MLKVKGLGEMKEKYICNSGSTQVENISPRYRTRYTVWVVAMMVVFDLGGLNIIVFH